MKKIVVFLVTILVPMAVFAMEKEPDKKKIGAISASALKKFKKECSKKEYERMLNILLNIADTFNKTELNNTPYEELLQRALKKILEQRTKQTIFIDKKKSELNDLLNPEQLIIAAASDVNVPDFLLHAVLVYAGTKYAKELFEQGRLTEALTKGKNANKQFAFPMPHKKNVLYKIPDEISGMPVFDQYGVLIAIPGKKCVRIFNTGSLSEQPLYKFRYLTEENAQLITFDSKANTLLCKMPGGDFFKYLDVHKYNSGDEIPTIEPVKKELNKTPKLNLGAQLIPTITTNTTTNTTTTNTPVNLHRNYVNTPRPQKNSTKTIFTSLPENMDITPLPPYTNRFSTIKSLPSGFTYFIDLETNKKFGDEQITPNELQPHYALLNKDNSRGVINSNNKTFELYNFITMLPLHQWFLGFCLRYGKLSSPVKLTAPWAVTAFCSFKKEEQDYLTKTYNIANLKKKLSQNAIPPLNLKALGKNGDKSNPSGFYSDR